MQKIKKLGVHKVWLLSNRGPGGKEDRKSRWEEVINTKFLDNLLEFRDMSCCRERAYQIHSTRDGNGNGCRRRHSTVQFQTPKAKRWFYKFPKIYTGKR